MWIGHNLITGLYWDGTAFAAKDRDDAVLLSQIEELFLRLVYQNTVTERIHGYARIMDLQ